jgi:hypothetical protein
MSSTTDAILTGLAVKIDTLVRDARDRAAADQRKAVEAMRAAAQEQMNRIDKRIDALARRRSLEPALWGAAAGALVCAAALALGVWLGDRGVSVSWLLTFGWHL